MNIKNLTKYTLVRYILVGGTSTFIHIIVASLYAYFIIDSVFKANIIGFFVAYIFSYILQSKLVFKHILNIKTSMKYFIVQFLSLIFAITISTLFASFNIYIKILITSMLLPLITFVIHKLWTFKSN